MSGYNLGEARGKIVLETDFSTLSEAEAALKKFEGAGNKAADAAGQQGEAVKKSLNTSANVAGAAGVTIAAGFGYAIKSASDFQYTMSQVKAVSGASSSQMEQISKAALRIGADTSFSAGEAGKAFEELIKAGISVEEALGGAADATVALAAAGEIALPEAASIASNAMNQFGLSAAELPNVANKIAGAANASAIDVSDFGQSISQAGAVANLVGASFDDTAAAIAIMGNAGIKGSDAGTSLKTMLMNLTPSTKAAREEMMELGIITEDGTNKFYDAEGSLKSLSSVSDTLKTALKGMSKEQQQAALTTLFGSDAIRGAAILAKGGAEGFNEMADSLGKISAADVAAARLDNLQGATEALKGSAETAAIVIGTPLLHAVTAVIDVVTNAVNAFAQLSSGQQRVISITAGVVGALLLLSAAAIKIGLAMASARATILAATGATTLYGSAGAIAAARMKAFAAAQAVVNAVLRKSPLILIVAAIALLVAGFIKLYNSSKPLQAAVATLGNALLTAFDALYPIVDAVGQVIGKVGAALSGSLASGTAAASSGLIGILIPAIQALAQFIESMIPGLSSFGATVANTIMGLASTLGPVIGGLLSSLAPVLGQVMSAIGQTVGMLVPIIGPVVAQLLAAFSTLAPVLASAGSAIATSLGSAIAIVLPALASLASTVMSQLVPPLLGLVTAVLPPLLAAFAQLVPVIVQLAGSVLMAVATLAGALIPVLAQVLAAVLPVVVQLVSALLPVFAQIIAAVLPLIAMLIGQLVPVFLQIVQAILPVVTMIIGQLVPVIAQLVAIIAPVVAALIGALLPVFSALIEAIMPLISTIVGILVPVLSAIISAVMPVIEIILGVLVPVFQQIANVVSTVMAAIVPIIQSAMTIIQGIINVVMGVISGNWSQVWAGLGQIVSGIWGVIKGVITGGINIVKSVITAGINIVKSIWTAAWSAIGSTIKGAISIISTAVSGIKNAVVNGLKNAGSWLVSAGKDIVNGLVNGIKSMVSSAANAAADLAKSAINSAKKFLHINSPSKVFHQIGVFVGQGLSNGIATTKAKVADTAKKVAAAIGQAFGKKQISETVARALYNTNAVVQREFGRMVKSADHLVDRMKAAQKKLADLQKQRSSYASAAADKANSVDAADQASSAGYLLNLKEQIARTKAFAKTLADLKKKGLDKRTYDDLVQAGPDSLEVAQEYQKGGKAAIKQMATLRSQLAKSASSLGNTVANNMYGAGVQAAKGLVKGIQSERRALDQAMDRMARRMVATVKRQLGIHSPSKVMDQQVGQQLPAGIDQGVSNNIKTLLASGRTMVQSLMNGVASKYPELASQLSGLTDMVPLDVRQVIQTNVDNNRATETAKQGNTYVQNNRIYTDENPVLWARAAGREYEQQMIGVPA